MEVPKAPDKCKHCASPIPRDKTKHEDAIGHEDEVKREDKDGHDVEVNEEDEDEDDEDNGPVLCALCKEALYCSDKCETDDL